ncbi:MAG: RDD family protein [Planctomycetota bacterium]
MAAAVQPLDTTIGVVTPENIAFEYQLAGPFRRLPAFLLDFVVRWAVIALIGFLLFLGGGVTGLFTASLGYLVMAMFMVAVFVISWFDGTILEAYFNGRTVGKWVFGIRVMQIDGRPVSPRSALLRNLLRIADLAPVAALNTWEPDLPLIYIIPTGIVGLVTMMATQRMQRLGDLAAGTMVVVDERKWQLPIAKVDDARVPALASYIPGDYLVSRKMARTLATYVERRHFLTPQRRREVARHLTDPLIECFEFRRDIDPDLLLYSLYYKTFLADSATESPDLGPLSGYSPLARDVGKPVGLAPGVNAPAVEGIVEGITTAPSGKESTE